MEKILVLPAPGSKIVAVIGLKPFVPFTQRPRDLEYDNPFIVQVIPCIMKGSQFEDLRTGRLVKLPRNHQIWHVSVGTMFDYGDRQLLVSRTVNHRLAIYEGVRFNPLSMVSYRAYS